MAGIPFSKKMTSSDKDIRYMATSDLLNELNGEDFELDVTPGTRGLVLATRLMNSILQQLDDTSSDVSGLALRCLVPFMKKVGLDQVFELTAKLADKLLNEKDQHRGIARIGLKTIISEFPSQSVAQITLSAITPRLIKGIDRSVKDMEIKCDCLDILCDALPRYGNLIPSYHLLLLNELLPQLSSTHATVRRKTVSCIASLASSLSDDMLRDSTAKVVYSVGNKEETFEIARTNIQMIGALSRAVGHRFGPHLGDIVPLLVNYCTRASENEEELREDTFLALESLLLGCQRAYCDEILELALEYISYDPHFADNIEEDADESNEEEDDDSANNYTDHKDLSWKVRQAAAKCLAACIVSQPEKISKLYEKACPKLIERFTEREENVKMNIFSTFTALLRQTGNAAKGQIEMNETSPKWLLKLEVPNIVRSIRRQLQQKSIQTKVGAFSVLKEVVAVLPNCLVDHIGSLVPEIERALYDKSATSNLKIVALVFARLLLASHSPSVFHPYVKALSSSVLSAIGDRYYKVTADALRVCGELIRVIRPSIESSSFDFKPYVHPIYNAIMSCLKIHDQDQEVKSCAIDCTGLVISTFSDNLKAELQVCLPVLVDRMGNEGTRVTAVKAFAVIAASPLRVDLSCVLEHVISELTSFLRKDNRALKQATLVALNSLFVAYGHDIGSDAYNVIITELSTFISDSDLHLTASALELCNIYMRGRRLNPSVCSTVRNKVLPRALTLIRSLLLRGQAPSAVQDFLTALVRSEYAIFDGLLDSLLSSAQGITIQALMSTAECVAVICLTAGDNKCPLVIKILTDILNDENNTNLAKKFLALLCLGEIGRRKDLSSHAHIENIVIGYFESPLEDIKCAASYALGNIAVGNLEKYLPFILDQINDQQKKKYLPLKSLKEVIVRHSAEEAEFQDSSVEKILHLLLDYSKSDEEDVRDVVAKCLGKLALAKPLRLLPALKEHTSSHSPFTRATVVTAIKYSVVDRPGKFADIIYPEISSFLMLIKDHDHNVRRAAVLALNTAANKKPNLIKGLLPELLPHLYNQTVVKEDMIRVVNLGPFNHVIDDGLELRKFSFECVDTLLDYCFDQVNPPSFILPHLKSGLADHYDVKRPSYSILLKLVDKCPLDVLAGLDALVDPLQKSVTSKPKQDATNREVDRNEDIISNALRAVGSIVRIRGGDYSQKFKNLVNEIEETPALAEKYSSIRNQ